MITVLNVCQHDKRQALRLLQWIGELGGYPSHQLVLSYNQTLQRQGGQHDLVAEAKKHFADVQEFVPFDENETGWPQSPNHAWLAVVQFIRDKVQQPWLWLEPDCVPLKSGWLDAIEAEYTVGAKPFMGAEIKEPSHRLSGVAVYPPKVVAFTRGLPHLANGPWDQILGKDFTQHAHYTSLIQHIWAVSRDPVVSPTFPDRESLALIKPEAVLFHRCKDDTLIDRLRETLPAGVTPEPVLIQVREEMKPLVAALIAANGGSNELPNTETQPKTWIGDVRVHVEALAALVDKPFRKQLLHNELRKSGLLGSAPKRAKRKAGK